MTDFVEDLHRQFFLRRVHFLPRHQKVKINDVRVELRSIELERTSATRLLHKNGTISMARGGPNSATSDFFICIGDQPSLDFGGKRNPDGQGFAAFGRVTKGMDIVKRIQASPAEGQTLVPPIKIHAAFRVPAN